jgi:hypothetical protein
MANRLDGRLRRLEALQGDDVDAILDDLSFEQGQALLNHLLAQLNASMSGTDLRSEEDKLLLRSPMNRERYERVLASIPEGTVERLLAAILERVARKEARAA